MLTLQQATIVQRVLPGQLPIKTCKMLLMHPLLEILFS